MADKQSTTDPSTWDLREDKSNKGSGYLGLLQRPDGTVMSEFSIGIPINGKEMDVPSIVPTLSEAEVKHLLTMKEGEQMPMSIVRKAADFATQRMNTGKPVWAQEGEQQNLFPQYQRATIQMPKVMKRVEEPTDPNALANLLLKRGM